MGTAMPMSAPACTSAGFIGSPPMNLVKVHVDDAADGVVVTSGDVRLELPASVGRTARVRARRAPRRRRPHLLASDGATWAEVGTDLRGIAKLHGEQAWCRAGDQVVFRADPPAPAVLRLRHRRGPDRSGGRHRLRS